MEEETEATGKQHIGEVDSKRIHQAMSQGSRNKSMSAQSILNHQ